MKVVSIAEAKAMSGVRIVTRKGVPTAWAEAAKGIFHVKRTDAVLAQEAESDEKGAHLQWTGEAGAPIVAYDDEKMRTGWMEILLLAERMAPAAHGVPALVPADGSQRATMFGVSNEICGELGLAWCLRLLMIDRALENEGAPGTFPVKIAKYLAAKYGYYPQSLAVAHARVMTILDTLSQTLGAGRYLVGDTLTAADIYWATFGNMFGLLSPEELPAAQMVRQAWGAVGGSMREQVPANLVAHHRYVYERYLTLPVQL
ncbi:MAG: hypothetical protein K0U93_29235 [Gammaproteobacteria bacterium]|nr:hypothetical protein [Gammaproteobacteria bacterium]